MTHDAAPHGFPIIHMLYVGMYNTYVAAFRSKQTNLNAGGIRYVLYICTMGFSRLNWKRPAKAGKAGEAGEAGEATYVVM